MFAIARKTFASFTLGLMALTSLSAQAEVLSFDDRPLGRNWFTADYMGFRFGNNNPNTNVWFSTSTVNQYYVPHSGSIYLSTDAASYNGGLFEDAMPITSATPFTFQGAYFTGGDQVYYKLFSGGSLVFTSAPVTVVEGPVTTWVGSGYDQLIDTVVVVGPQGYFGMDNFTYNATPVPEAGTLGLFTAGLLGVAAIVRRRKV